MLDGGGKLALVAGTDARAAVIADPAVGINKTLQSLDIFVVELNIIIGAKMAVFGHSKGIGIKD